MPERDRKPAGPGDVSPLLDIMKRLRAPDGCPWDREQTFSTIAPYTIEEAYEVADAIARGDLDDLREELGDLLLQVVYHAEMAAERGAFDFADVHAAICAKMIRRHPHVFGSEEDRGKDPEPGFWEDLKAQEKSANGKQDGALTGVPVAMAALSRAQKLQKKAARVGFDWPDAAGVVAKLAEESDELTRALNGDDRDAIAHELGDVLFTVVNLARHCGIDAEAALRAANERFVARFTTVERLLAERGKSLGEASGDEREQAWREAKKLARKP